jgi:hypothetical protein
MMYQPNEEVILRRAQPQIRVEAEPPEVRNDNTLGLYLSKLNQQIESLEVYLSKLEDKLSFVCVQDLAMKSVDKTFFSNPTRPQSPALELIENMQYKMDSLQSQVVIMIDKVQV